MFALKRISPTCYRLNVKDGNLEMSWVVTSSELKEILKEADA